jgi:stress response protein YsnF
MTDITEAQATGEDSNQVVAMFENYDKAKAARDVLVARGVPSSGIEILDQSGSARDTGVTYEGNEEGIWGAVKRASMPDEDAHLYAEGVRRGHAMLVVRVGPGDRDSVLYILESLDPIDVETRASEWRQEGWSGVHAGQTAWETQRAESAGTPTTLSDTSMTTPVADGPAGAGAAHEEVVPVYEERLRVGKREVGRGSVRVRSYVVETPVQEQVSLHDERVEVERRPVDRIATGSELGAAPLEERTVELTARGEEPVIAKEMRVKEEVAVRKEGEDRT